MIQDGEDKMSEGMETTIQLTSVENPAALPETTCPTGPERGFRAMLPIVPDITAKVWVAASPAPAFV
jgi:hypothetical protein